MKKAEVLNILQNLPQKYWTIKEGKYYHTESQTAINKQIAVSGMQYIVSHDRLGQIYVLSGYQIRKFCQSLDKTLALASVAEKNRKVLDWANEASRT